MVKHTQTIRPLLPTNYFSVFDHVIGLALKGLRCHSPRKTRHNLFFSLIMGSKKSTNNKKGVLKKSIKFTGKHLYQSLFFNKVAGLRHFIKKETPTQMFFCEFCEIFKSTFFYCAPPVTASMYASLPVHPQ